MTKIRQILNRLLVLAILTLPLTLFAQEAPGLVECGHGSKCEWNELLALINKIIDFVLFKLAVPIAAIMFFYAGFLLITAGGEVASARTKAKGIFLNTVLGLIIAIAAWLIINLLLSILGYDGDWIGLTIGK